MPALLLDTHTGGFSRYLAISLELVRCAGLGLEVGRRYHHGAAAPLMAQSRNQVRARALLCF